MKYELEPSEELRLAQREVELSRLQVEQALEHLEEKVVQSSLVVKNFVHKVRTPERWIRQYPFLNIAVFASLGYFIGRRWARPTPQNAVSLPLPQPPTESRPTLQPGSLTSQTPFVL